MVVEAVFAVIAEGTRRDILEALAREHKAVGQLVEELGVSQPTVSKHLRVLREAGVVTMRAQGQKRYYSINTKPLSMVSQWLDDLGAGVDAGPRTAAVPGGAFSAHGGAAGNGNGAPFGSVPSGNGNGAPSGSVPSGNGNGAPSGSVPAAASAAAPSAGAPSAAAAAAPAAAAAAPIPPAPGEAAGATTVAAPATAREVAAVGPAGEHDPSVQQQISRSVGRAANKAADLLASLPAFRRRRE